MSWRNIKLIFAREVRDQLRDRRTLFMIAVLPLLLYPGLGIGMLYMTQLFSEQARTVVVLGSDNLPVDPPLLQDGTIVSNWFEIPSHADTLRVVTDSSRLDGEAANDAARGADRATLLAEAASLKDRVLELRRLEEQSRVLSDSVDAAGATADPGSGRQLLALQDRIGELREEIGDLFGATSMEVLILVPDGFAENMERMNQQIQQRNLSASDYERPVIVRNSADDKSLIAFHRVQESMDRWEQALLKRRLTIAQLPESLPTPVQPAEVDLALDDQRAANVWSKLFPALLIIMTVTGAFYPAIDIGAGEKERGTMETLLICPATRTEIVLGKFFTVMLFSMATALLNILSMAMTGGHLRSMAGSALSKIGDLSIPPVSSMVWMFVLLVPLAAFFSALCLSLATFARSSKEGQYYLSPLLMVTLGLTVFCLSPAVEISPDNESSWFFSVMPVMGPALLLKAMLLVQNNTAELYLYAVPVLITSFAYSLMALWWAIDQFSRESVLFREAERFELGLWLRHLLRDKEPLPSFVEAGFCFILIMLLQFGAMRFMAGAFGGAFDGMTMMKLLMIQQLVIVALPALLMGVMLTTSVRQTFRLNYPSVKLMAVAVLLPVVLHPLSLELQASLSWFFPKLPESVTSVIATMADSKQSLGLVLLAFAVAPAICEEIAFRGFILSGFGRAGRRWLAVGLSSLTFGLMHMIPQQVFNATLLGLVLGMIALRSRSLFPCMGFHFVFNALAVLHSRAAEWISPTGIAGWFFRLEDGQLRYETPTIALASVLSIWFLIWLTNYGRLELDRESRDECAGLPGLSPKTPMGTS